MSNKAHSEDDLKKILKTLFSDKKRVNELKEELQSQSPKELFHAKIEKLQMVALEEELLQMKGTLVEQGQQQQLLTEQAEKAKAHATALQEKVSLLEEQNKQLQKDRELKEHEWNSSQENAKAQYEKWLQEKGNLEKKHAKLQQQMAELAEEKEHLQENYLKLEKAFKQNQRHFRDESEAHFSEMRLLQEKIHATEHQLKQTDLAKVHEEYEAKWALAKEEHKELVDKLNLWVAEARAEKDLLLHELAHVKQSAMHALDNKEKILLEGQQVVQEWMMRCHQLEEERAQLKRNLEEIGHEKENLQRAIKELGIRVEEGEAEVHKAQLHLAKKVKESALLQDVAQKQKEQILETQKLWSKENERRLALEKCVDGYQQKEDELKSYATLCNQEAKEMIDGLEERCNRAMQEIERLLLKINELEKYKEAYESLHTKLTNLTQ